jgi:carboxypeptidase family protein
MIPLPPGIRGRVLRADTGAPVPLFWVRLHHVVQSDITHATRLQTKVRSHLPWFRDDYGQFWFTRFYGPGEFAVDAGTDDGLVSQCAVQARVEAGTPPPTVELRLVPAATIRGRVLTPDATPTGGARVSAHDPETGRMLGRGWLFPHADGIYVMAGLRPGRVELRARHDDWYEVRTTVRVESGSTIEHDLRLGREGAVLMLAVHDLTGRPVSGARLRLFTPLGEEVHADMHKYHALYAARFRAQGRTSFDSREYRHEILHTNEDGHLERRFIPPGDYVVQASLKGYRPERRRVSVRTGNENRVELTFAPEK